MTRLHKIKSWYEYNEQRISFGSLLLGFVIDSLTLQNIDALRENLWIAGNLLVVAIVIILLNSGKESDKKHFWLTTTLQFSFGALLGSFFIFYFRSTTLLATWPFLLVLLMAMVANELFQKKYAKLAFQLSLLYFAIFSFSIFLIPLLLKKIGVEIFILSGLAGLVIIWVYLRLLEYFAREKFLEGKTNIWILIWTIFIGVNFLYFTHLIPPIPLSLKEAGIYQVVQKLESGVYRTSGEVRGPERFFTFWPKVHWVEGSPLYAYTSIFAPGSLSTEILHDWQYQNSKGEWVTATVVSLPLSGGRTGGFRTFSQKYNFTPGKWRVDVKTRQGQILGRLNFEVVPATVYPPLESQIH